MKTANPLLVSIAEAGFQLDIPAEDIKALIENRELVAVRVRGYVLVRYDSLVKFVRRAVPFRGSELDSESRMPAAMSCGPES